MKVITLSSYKGGVGKTTSSICLSCWLSQHGNTLLIDSDPNRSATGWSRGDGFPFQICHENAAPRLMGRERFDFLVIDTPARPAESDLNELVEGCDLLLLPTTPDSLALDALGLMAHALPKGANYHVLLTMIPPSPQKDGAEALAACKEVGFPVLERGIRYFKVYKNAAAERKPIYSMRGGKTAWRDWTELGKLEPLQQLLK